MPTIKDVARQAGVSIATVSNYLNNTKPVSKSSSLKIQAAIDDLKYTQNLSAKSLKSCSYPDIGIILPNLDDSHYVQIFQGIENAFQNSDYYANLAFSYDIPDFEKNIVRGFIKKQIQGLILVSCQPDQWKFYHDQFSSLPQSPIVLIDREIYSLDANYVSFDNYSAMLQITSELIRNDILSICLVSGPAEFTCEEQCMLGFKAAYERHALKCDPSLIAITDMSKEGAFRKTIQILHDGRPDAIISTSESIAAGVIEAVRTLGYSEGEIPVLTLGEEHWNLSTHSFATASFPRPAIRLGQTAANLLLEQIRSPLTADNEKIIIKDMPENSFHISLSARPPKAAPSVKRNKKLRILMVDTPQVHALLGILRNFENQADIVADVTILPHHYLYETILEKHNSDKEIPFDVFMFDIPWLSALASKHILADITDELKGMGLGVFFPDCLKYFGMFNERYFALPFMYGPQILYYRKDLFDDRELQAEYSRKNNIRLRPPRTLKEFNTIADFFTNHTNVVDYGISVPAAYDECLVPEIYMRINAYGGSVFDSHGNVCFDRDSTLKAYINLTRSIRLAKPDYRTATDVSIVQDFLKGETAMLISYPSFLADEANLRKSILTGSIGYYHIPGRSALLGGWSLGLSSRSKKINEGITFLKWICSAEIANYFTLLGGQTAITSAYTNDELTKLYPYLPVYYSAYQYSKPVLPPHYAGDVILSQTEIDSIISKWFYSIFDDNIELQSAISNTQADLEKLVRSAETGLSH